MTHENASNKETQQPQNEADSSSQPEASEPLEGTVVGPESDEVLEEQGFDWKIYANELELKLAAAEAKIEDQKDSVLRSIANSENARRRADQEVDKARKFALEKFAGELLAVVDNLERATQAADAENESVKPLLEGIALTHKLFMSTFEKFGIELIDPQGEIFNPEQHQAMSLQENEEFSPNTVMAVMQKGYSLKGRLLRPAMVMVSRGGTTKVDTQV
ncbi:protein grpE [Glaciecola punicea ACAM 611]|jgi:molecular chaperone GrpE|uniref:Protein GrpE n=1 Tax=Glaciecola punicea ACAM 611 TaxID=1121923 RepID=H5T8U9_9ALTE|nr:nucleotide exchange factor GrpE [Glaciecola punicea]GAB54726.1 protein grpE [Glaciecola punicea ACAM 611]